MSAEKRMRARCPLCGSTVRIDAVEAGRAGPCPRCGEVCTARVIQESERETDVKRNRHGRRMRRRQVRQPLSLTSISVAWFYALGALSLGGTLVSIALAHWTDTLYVDLSFVLWFLLASHLRRRNAFARKLAIGISGVWIIGLLTLMAAGLGGMSAEPVDADAPEVLYYLGGLALLLLVGPPGMLLLHPRVRAGFAVTKAHAIGTPPPGSTPEAEQGF